MYQTYLTLLGLSIISNILFLIILYRFRQRSITTISLIILLFLVDIWFIPKFITNAFHASGFLTLIFRAVKAFTALKIPAQLSNSHGFLVV